MHEWLQCASGVSVTALKRCGLLQCLMIIVITWHGGNRPAYKKYATLFVITLSFDLNVSHATLGLLTAVVLHTATLSKVRSTVSRVCTYRFQWAFGPGRL